MKKLHTQTWVRSSMCSLSAPTSPRLVSLRTLSPLDWKLHESRASLEHRVEAGAQQLLQLNIKHCEHLRKHCEALGSDFKYYYSFVY